MSKSASVIGNSVVAASDFGKYLDSKYRPKQEQTNKMQTGTKKCTKCAKCQNNYQNQR